MKYEVSEEVIAQTTMCPSDFGCLETGECHGRPIREAKEVAFGMALFVTYNDGNDCPYRRLFGSGTICRCPTRQAIHEKYQV